MPTDDQMKQLINLFVIIKTLTLIDSTIEYINLLDNIVLK